MEKCYEYLGCSKVDCIMHRRKDNKYCWEVEETLCNSHSIEIARKKVRGKKADACFRSGCIYFNAAKKRYVL